MKNLSNNSINQFFCSKIDAVTGKLRPNIWKMYSENVLCGPYSQRWWLRNGRRRRMLGDRDLRFTKCLVPYSAVDDQKLRNIGANQLYMGGIFSACFG